MRRRSALALGTIVLCVLVLYGSSVGYGFVYDDVWTITKNRGLTAPLPRILHALVSGRGARIGLADNTRPTMVVSTWIDRDLFGLTPAGFHAHSLVLYALVCICAWLALRVLVGRPRAAWLGALFFGAAPLHAEVVACVGYREDLLVALYGLVVIAVFFAPRRFRSPRPTLLEIASTAIALALALGAKESGFCIPLLLAAMGWARRSEGAFLRRRADLAIAIVLVTAVFLNWRATIPSDVPRAHDPGLTLRALAVVRYEVRAVFGSLLPFFPAPERGPAGPASAVWLLPFIGLLGAMVRLRGSARGRPFATALAIALVAPMASSPIALPANEFADRYLFLGIFGGAMAFGAGVERALEHGPAVRHSAAGVLAALLAVAMFKTVQARSVFRSDADLWQAAVAHAPDSPRAWTGLSRVLRIQGRLADAADADAHALALDPSYPPARLTRAYNLLAQGDVVDGRAELSRFGEDDRLNGLALARECASLAPEQAKVCIAGR